MELIFKQRARTIFRVTLFAMAVALVCPPDQLWPDAGAAERLGDPGRKSEDITNPANQRALTPDAFLGALRGKPKAAVEIVFTDGDGEAFWLALQFRDLLRAATWAVSEPTPARSNDLAELANQPAYMITDAQLTGVAVAMRADNQEEFEAFGDRQADTALNALLEAILVTLGSVIINAADPAMFPAPPYGTLRIVIGPAPGTILPEVR